VHQRAAGAQDGDADGAARRAAGLLAYRAGRRGVRSLVVGDPASGPDVLRSRVREGVEAGHGPAGSVGDGGFGHYGEADVRLRVEQYERVDGGGDEFRLVGRVDTAGCEEFSLRGCRNGLTCGG